MLIANSFKMFKLKQKNDSSYSYLENVQTLRHLIKGDNIVVSWKIPRSLFIFMCDYFFILCPCKNQHLHNAHKLLNRLVNWEFLTRDWKGRNNRSEGRRKEERGKEIANTNKNTKIKTNNQSVWYPKRSSFNFSGNILGGAYCVSVTVSNIGTTSM